MNKTLITLFSRSTKISLLFSEQSYRWIKFAQKFTLNSIQIGQIFIINHHLSNSNRSVGFNFTFLDNHDVLAHNLLDPREKERAGRGWSEVKQTIGRRSGSVGAGTGGRHHDR
jgi:hypothetical protein